MNASKRARNQEQQSRNEISKINKVTKRKMEESKTDQRTNREQSTREIPM
jgi:hypothetical protein